MKHMTTPVRVLLVEPNEVSRKGVRAVLEETGEFVVTERSEPISDVDDVAVLSSDLIVLGLPAADPPVLDSGLETIDMLAREDPERHILAIVPDPSFETFVAVARAGVKGVVSRDGSARALIDCIRSVAAGHCAVGPRIACSLLAHFGASAKARFAGRARSGHSLTDREQEVLDQLIRGLRNAEIGRKLGLSAGTVKSHVRQIYRKLGVRDRTEAILMSVSPGRVT
jgi:DNA-binding NarL/FixJ family response regulator